MASERVEKDWILIVEDLGLIKAAEREREGGQGWRGSERFWEGWRGLRLSVSRGLEMGRGRGRAA